jgi:hypothetical protein
MRCIFIVIVVYEGECGLKVGEECCQWAEKDTLLITYYAGKPSVCKMQEVIKR